MQLCSTTSCTTSEVKYTLSTTFRFCKAIMMVWWESSFRGDAQSDHPPRKSVRFLMMSLLFDERLLVQCDDMK